MPHFMKKIPYAVGNFEQIQEQGFYYVDKTFYISVLEEWNAPVFLRPRRFGKSLWCSTLECYYDINRKDKFNSLFGKTWIGQNPTQLKNAFMVMRLNFSVVSVKPDVRVIEDNFIATQSPTIKKFLSRYGALLGDLNIAMDMPVANQLQIIIEAVDEYKLPPLYLIIDEYDNFTNQLITSRNDDLYKALTTGDSFLRSFFKVIKSGVEMQSIGKVFITGVLPITIDDLTSGFNIAQMITLQKQFANMMGFTHKETKDYLSHVFKSYGFDSARMPEILEIMENHYDGYRFLPDVEQTLYNSTIVTFFLKHLVVNGGQIPRELIDDNLKTDVSWIQRLTTVKENTDAMMDALVFDNALEYDLKQLVSKFNMHKFFEKDYYPVSLFYLGMVTCFDDFSMCLPNNTMREIFVDYYNELNNYEVSKGYTQFFRQFLAKPDLEKLFTAFYETYLGQFPAQAWDKINENFVRCTFYEICTRYLSRYFTFSMEVNYPSGRSDWEMTGKYHTKYKDTKTIIEFKYLSSREAGRILSLKTPKNDELTQVLGYKKDALKMFPEFKVTACIIYVAANKGFRFFKL
ncbi:AAA family ATPase [Desulfobacter latus]|uniref:AAA family ATPase n=1 Tax=Desulfobacter latus TaxID=2292 RepID=A0A850T825_9BACT|nr:AAA family ATPase [Desulfobacter latus]NWH05285.1 AAA family ATPase [Desulfobacter latus]